MARNRLPSTNNGRSTTSPTLYQSVSSFLNVFYIYAQNTKKFCKAFVLFKKMKYIHNSHKPPPPHPQPPSSPTTTGGAFPRRQGFWQNIAYKDYSSYPYLKKILPNFFKSHLCIAPRLSENGDSSFP